MIQQALFAKAKRVAFSRPRRETSRYGDRRRVWLRDDRAVKIVYTTTICDVPITPSFKVVALLDNGECLVSRHRKLSAAMRTAKRFAQPTDPQPTKRKKVRR